MKEYISRFTLMCIGLYAIARGGTKGIGEAWRLLCGK